MNPNISHLAASPTLGSGSALIDLLASLVHETPKVPNSNSLLPKMALPTAVLSTDSKSPTTTIPPTTTVPTTKQNSIQLKKSQGLYITKN